jgi:UDP-N-acetylmuramyl-tripeptide synthetase
MQRWHTPEQAAHWLRTQVQGRLQTDSRRVQSGDGFIAWPGGVTDARRFVPDVLQQGARACLVEARELEQHAWSTQLEGVHTAHVASYDGLKAACGPIAAAYYEQPSARIHVLAITGTNGKTSTAWWLSHALQVLGQRCALVGTLGVGEPGALQATGMTTPDPVLLQAHLRQWVDAGVDACAMEASSIGLAEHRLNGTQIRVAVFTNFTQDHLDYHGSMDAYWQAKAALFDWPGLEAAVVNIDDPQGAGLAQSLQPRRGLAVWTFSLHASANALGDGHNKAHNKAHADRHLHARGIRQSANGLTFEVCEGTQYVQLQTRLVGHYNVSNLLGVIAVLRAMGHTLADAAQACADLPAVPGRMQQVVPQNTEANAGSHTAQPCVVVDYAHTPDAVAQALQALRPLAQARGGSLTCVLGCGGDRDTHKRPLMAAAAEQHADRIVLTSDNPRSENPQHIVAQMRAGLSPAASVEECLDRAHAIAHAVAHAHAHDVVLIAGKGHEDYQEVAGVRHPFSDVTHAQAALQTWRAHG